MTGGPALRLRPGHVGVQPRPQPLRHARGADAAAVLDGRLHRLDGGPALRVLGHHAVPLPQPGRALGAPPSRWSGCPTSAPRRGPRGPAPAAARGQATSWPRARRSSRRDRRSRPHAWWPRPARGPRLRDRPRSTTTWKIYEVQDAPLVTPLTNEPAVLTGVEPGQSQLARPFGQPGTTTRRAGTSSWPPAARVLARRRRSGTPILRPVPVAPTTVSRRAGRPTTRSAST